MGKRVQKDERIEIKKFFQIVIKFGLKISKLKFVSSSISIRVKENEICKKLFLAFYAFRCYEVLYML